MDKYRSNVRLYTSYFLYHRFGNSNGGHGNCSDGDVLYKSKNIFRLTNYAFPQGEPRINVTFGSEGKICESLEEAENREEQV